MFIDSLRNELNNEKQLTENGAVGYRTSGKKLLDLNFKITSLRNASDEEIEKAFFDAYYEEPILALRWLFYARDVREGIGERRLFRVCLKALAKIKPELVKALIALVPEFGRWDDLWCLLDSPSVEHSVIRFVKAQLSTDYNNMKAGKLVSLLGKWLCRSNTSSKETKRLAKIIYTGLGMKESTYRKKIAAINKHLKTVEVSMSANQWDQINYPTVPSRANLIYKDAFMRHDEERRKEYLESLKNGETKINASVLFPHDVAHKYTNGYWHMSSDSADDTIEELWKNLPDYIKGAGNTICVADGSGSMDTPVGNTRVTALEVANALAIYFAEHSSGEFKDKYITFSERPQLVDFSNAHTLYEKINIALRHNEVANTNIEAVFRLILRTAIRNRMKQEDMPKNVLILSDMEFDHATYGDTSKTLFENLANNYRIEGYKLPRLVFWNINSRTATIPLQENESGVALVSGFSPVIANMVLSNELDPFKCLLNEIGKERYDVVEEVCTKYL